MATVSEVKKMTSASISAMLTGSLRRNEPSTLRSGCCWINDVSSELFIPHYYCTRKGAEWRGRCLHPVVDPEHTRWQEISLRDTPQQTRVRMARLSEKHPSVGKLSEYKTNRDGEFGSGLLEKRLEYRGRLNFSERVTVHHGRFEAFLCKVEHPLHARTPAGEYDPPDRHAFLALIMGQDAVRLGKDAVRRKADDLGNRRVGGVTGEAELTFYFFRFYHWDPFCAWKRNGDIL